MKISIEYEVTYCGNCPYLGQGQTYGNDGRDGSNVFVCRKGAFGGNSYFKGYSEGLWIVPNKPPEECPFNWEKEGIKC